MKGNFVFIVPTIFFIFFTHFIDSFFSFFYLLPLIHLIYKKHKKNHQFLMIFFYFFIFNIIPTFWLAKVNIFQGVLAWITNSFMASIVIYTCIYLTTNINNTLRFITFLCFWIAFECIHFTWFFNWPWLTIGNTIANKENIIQWYSYVGVIGGSFWIISINILIYQIVFSINRYQFIIKIVLLFFIISVPILCSIKLYNKSTFKVNSSINVMIVQPYANTLKQKVNESKLIDKIFDSTILESKIKPNLVLLTETFLKESVWDNNLKQTMGIQHIVNKMKKNKIQYCVIGLLIKKENILGKRTHQALDIKYDLFDAAICFDTFSNFQIHYKSNLIPIEENIPNFFNFSFINSDNFTKGKDFNNFVINKNIVNTAICYESIFTNSIRDMCNNGSELILSIANEQLLKMILKKSST